jgi:uncharacterized protein (DUF1810 family)
MQDLLDLDRFVAAQARVYDTVVGELRTGRKVSHWMWFIFPQIDGLGISPTAKHYAIRSMSEADAYLTHPLLGPRLIECTGLVNGIEDKTVHDVFGSPDDMKFHSSVTLFSMLTPCRDVFETALLKYFSGELDPRTVAIVDRRGDRP